MKGNTFAILWQFILLAMLQDVIDDQRNKGCPSVFSSQLSITQLEVIYFPFHLWIALGPAVEMT